MYTTGKNMSIVFAYNLSGFIVKNTSIVFAQLNCGQLLLYSQEAIIFKGIFQPDVIAV